MGFYEKMYEEIKKELLVRLYRYFVKNGVLDGKLDSIDAKVSLVEKYLKESEECYNDYLGGKISLSKLLRRFYNYELDENSNIKIEYLDDWTRYFVSGESRDIPMWVKLYSIQWGINNYTDFEKLSFNPSIFRKSCELISRCLGVKEYASSSAYLEKYAFLGDIIKVYSRLETMFFEILNISSPEGEWIKYEHHDEGNMDNNEPDYLRMYNLIRGKRTSWSIGSSEYMAKNKLLEGPIYVYYIKGEEGEFNIPKLLIQINKSNNDVLALLGVLPENDIELHLLDVVEEKLRSLSVYDKYSSSIRQLRTLAEISVKTFINRELTVEELEFLYDIAQKKDYFIERSSCLKSLLTIRNKKKDIGDYFGCKADEVSFDFSDLNKGVMIYCGDDIGKSSFSKPAIWPEKYPQILLGSISSSCPLEINSDITFPSKVYGDVYFDFNIKRFGANVTLPQEIYGDFIWNQLDICNNVTFPNYIAGHFNMNFLSNGDNIVFPEKIEGGMYMASVKSLNGTVLPKKIGGDLSLRSLESLIGVVLPDSVGGCIEIYGEKYSLEAVKKMQQDEESKGISVIKAGPLGRTHKPSGFINITLMLISVFLFGILSFVITLLILK